MAALSPEHDIIAAIATAPGRGGIGIVRVSGGNLASFAQQILRTVPQPRYAGLTAFIDAAGEMIDEGVALYFPAPNSYTGEDVLELQGHGGPVILKAVLNRCLQLGARIANPGEFTRRAFLNDKLDLAQAESVVDLIDATSEAAARSALRSLTGEFSQYVKGLNSSLIELRMLIEAILDFPEEELDYLQAAKIYQKLDQILENLLTIESTARQGSVLREGIRVVLIGQPNVGKSSLLNRLAARDVSIVTAVAGTTRDAIRETVQIDGVPVHIIDTAGLRDTSDEVETIGIDRTWQEIAEADVALLLVDAQHGLTQAEHEIIARLPARLPVYTIHNKIDLNGTPAHVAGTEIYLSARTGEGLAQLREALLHVVGWQTESSGIFMARERHLHALRSARGHLEVAKLVPASALELLAEELRLAQYELSAITGEFSADDLLGEIFSRFCIGK
ncbi:MAG: tRNA uridine-5-carboxymethylaminomethyl(34) synthesis GTPase MnmE [Burkholderiales bacterium]